MSRVFVRFLKKTDKEWLFEILPLTVDLAGDIRFRLQRLAAIYDACDNGDVVDQDERVRQEVTLRELLTVAAELNYADSRYGQEQMTLVMRGTFDQISLMCSC